MSTQREGQLTRTSAADEVATSRSELFIGGDWRLPSTSGRIEVENPTSEKVFGHVPDADAQDVDAAVRAARTALPGWSATSTVERRGYLTAFSNAIARRREPLAHLVTAEMGTPIELSRVVQADLPVAVLDGFIEALADLDHVEEVGNSLVLRESAGVVAAITPWNYPIHQAVSKVGAALAAGCTVVLKPSQVTPLSAYLLAEAAVEARLPDGVFNLVTGTGRAVGEALSQHPLVDVVSFTGSTSAGSAVMRSAAGTIKKVALELGGKSANVILPDADLASAVARGVEHVLENSGQTCTAWTRMVVPRDRQDEVVDLVRSVFASVVLGDPLDPDTTMGPVATADQRRTVEGYVDRGRVEGARLAATTDSQTPGTGHFVRPVAFADVTSAMSIAQEEIFGPVLAILPYDDERQALEIANDSIYGLSGAVWSADQERATSFARKMRTGQVSVNGGSFNPAAPFGGYKQSGVGRELGRHGLDDFLEIKAIQL